MKIRHHALSTPKYELLHLLVIILLYAGVISLIQLIFVYVDLSIVDPLETYYSTSSAFNTVRWASSVLIVCAPLFVLLNRSIYKAIVQNDTLQHAWARRWLLTITLFLAAVTIIGCLISVIYNFYNGELTLSFTLKVLTLLLLAGGIFGYFRWDMARVIQQRDRVALYSGVATLVTVASVIIAGFVIVGSPAHQRNVLLDQQRVEDLITIQNGIGGYYETHTRLPETLTALEEPSYYSIAVPIDPTTELPYEYRITGELSFELCATFVTQYTESKDGRQPHIEYFDYATTRFTPYTDSWNHSAERTCFERTMNPQAIEEATPTK